MSALEMLLREQGMNCRVEARERLAILVPDSTVTLDRSRAIELARDAGFTHVALELDPDGAPLPER